MRFTKGKGDMGQFIMQQALKRGARPVATNSLPAIGVGWRYSEDQYGVVLQLPRERFSDVQVFCGRLSARPHTNRAKRRTAAGWVGMQPRRLGLVFSLATIESARRSLSYDHNP